ncbi:MAG: hypothetical protein OEM28_11625 [Nitrosopumilus sp.]|nr:hypothetical protein [Nitrosopumilus sp.]MDH3488483.1 hypothetical protein [Nitrosopumilus sp.]
MKINFRSSHDGFVFSIPLMIGIAFIIFAALIGISQGFVEVGGLLVPELITDMPTFFDYDDVTGDMMLDVDGNPASNERIDLYWLLVSISVIILVAVAIVAVLGYVFEIVRWIHPGTAIGIIKKIVLFLIVFLVFPFVWDIYAIIIENFSLFLLDPFGTGDDPSNRTLELWRAMGSVIPVDIFDLDAWASAFTDPGTFAQGMMKDVFLALFKGFAVMFMTAMMFIISTIRILLTIIIAMSIPLLLTLSLIPMFRSVKDMLFKNLIGLSIAPVFSALVLTTGLAYLDSTTLPAMQDWFASLAVGFLAVFFPVMLAPMLGNIVTQVGQMMSTAIMAGSIVGGMVGQGALGGVAKSLGSTANSAATMAGMSGAAGLGRLGGGGNSGMKPPISSQELGMAGIGSAPSMGRMSSGNTPMAFGNDALTKTPGVIEHTPMSFGEKFKTGMKGAIYGGGTGLAAGSLKAAGHAMHVDQAVNPMVHDIQNAGMNKAFEAGQISVANHSLNDISKSMTAMEPPQVNAETIQAVMPETGESSRLMTNPGDTINSMENLDRVNNRFGTLEGQQEYLNVQRSNVPHFESLKPEIQNQIDQRLVEQLEKHPFSAEKIVDEVRGTRGRTFQNRI